ncbi:helix-turn-helix domain-containing protein [Streptomyces sp. NBC_00687]|uniref:helix-turn-helix domain-containing protein n=1 Tax=Streptomyces sp. NBC_00687 TaxID=2975807 RepID=UPI0022561AE8|nr:helix-turn-helix domain-containing protein [Streptomyces sp. NBC_00687]MCX4912470.1 helix-turn-helix domain-containing protein [Streptomyces sp. NBC_00687]
MTTDLLAHPSHPMPSHPRRRDGMSPLPAPEARARLRRSWHLSERQVATAFGVTPATVRSWEAGRTTPTGRRRAAYAAFLSGLAQGLAPVALADPAPQKKRTPAPPKKRASAPPKKGIPVAPAPSLVRALTPPPRNASASRPARPATPPPATVIVSTPPLAESARRPAGLPVAGGPDPVSAARRRRLRLAAVAAGVWLTFVHLMVTTSPPRTAYADGGDHGRALTGRVACSCAGSARP